MPDLGANRELRQALDGAQPTGAHESLASKASHEWWEDRLVIYDARKIVETEAERDRLAERVEALVAVLRRIATTADTVSTETGGRAIVLQRIADEIDAVGVARHEQDGK